MQGPEIFVRGLASGYDVEHLARLFFPRAPLRTSLSTRGALVYARAGRGRMVAALRGADGALCLRCEKPDAGVEPKTQLARLVYALLQEQTGIQPPWGMLTGVRPVSLLRKRGEEYGPEQARRILKKEYDVSDERLALIEGIVRRQRPILAAVEPRHYSLYVSIPFCPSRCSYCSFVSRTVEREAHLIQPYMEKLAEELALTAETARQCGLTLASVYVGGGTPTALDAQSLEELLCAIHTHFPGVKGVEFTVEAGRPDCTDAEKLRILKAYGVNRISINPQSMSDGVLAGIGRRHTAGDVRRCFAEARAAGHENINMDLIAGLAGDTEKSFRQSLEEVLDLGPENITLHTLTLKRASDLVVEGRAQASAPQAMLQIAYPLLAGAGYAPYYLYRQKNTVENLENTGWARPGTEGLYNVYIMEDRQTILSVGAGASTKLVANGGAKVSRSYNFKFPADYIARFGEITEKKKGVCAFYARHLDTETPG